MSRKQKLRYPPIYEPDLKDKIHPNTLLSTNQGPFYITAWQTFGDYQYKYDHQGYTGKYRSGRY